MKRNLFLFIAISLTIGIGVLSLIQLENAPIPKVSISDKSIHTIAYIILNGFWLLSLKNTSKLVKHSVLTSFFVFVYGIIIEVMQGTLTVYREFDFFDIIANFIGIIVAFVLFITVLKKISIN